MDIDFYLANNETGKIELTGTTDSSRLHIMEKEGFTLYEGSIDALTEYIDHGIKTHRPKLFSETTINIEADGVDHVSFNLPAKTLLYTINGNFTIEEDQLFYFSTAEPGNFYFSFFPPFPYQQLDLEIKANA